MARIFVAVPLPETIRTGIGRTVEPFLPRSHFRRIPEENLHITLAFIGEVSEEKVITAARTVERSVTSPPDTRTGAQLTLATAGAFPRPGDPRVIWIDIIKGRRALEALHRRVTASLDEASFPFDRKPFRPHLTIAYRRNSRDAADRRAAADAVRSLREHLEPLRWETAIPRVVLYRSELTRSGALYTPVMFEQ